MEPVFKALADPNRRLLLDKLHEQDGQTLLELQRCLPDMTRFGTMKHLKVLEEAGLVITQRSGREKHHYLNRVPIQLVYDRWVSKYAKPWTRSLTGLKQFIERNDMTNTMNHIFEVYIQAKPEQIWKALTDGAITQQYYFGTSVHSDWKVGSPYQYLLPDGNSMLNGEIVEIDPPRRLVTTFQPVWEGAEGVPVTTVIYEIEPMGEVSKLRLVHEGLEPGSEMATGTYDGWSRILSGLKTFLETGEPLPIPPASN